MPHVWTWEFQSIEHTFLPHPLLMGFQPLAGFRVGLSFGLGRVADGKADRNGSTTSFASSVCPHICPSHAWIERSSVTTLGDVMSSDHPDP